MDLPLFRLGKLFGGPPYLVDEVDPDVVISLAAHVVAKSRSTRQVYHFPIRDFHVEPIYNIGYALEKISYHISRGDSVYVHCLGGCGRTGTVISAYLILFHGYSYQEAIHEFVSQRGCSIESYEQELFLEVLDRLIKTWFNVDKIVGVMKRSITLDNFMNYIEKIVELNE